MRKVTILKDIEEKIGSVIHNVQTEVDETKPKYMATFPYPYMNGKLHLGHAFTMCKVDFECRWKEINGYNVLFPFGFHCTGMPISASAKKLEKEFETGKIEGQEKMTQYEILLSSGIPKETIKEFIDPKYWIGYFPQFGIRDITKLGLMVDKRRSFITTDINPFYDSFIKWQFNKLQEKGYLKFGTRNSIYSQNLEIQCQDHDRSLGEGVQIESFSIVEYQINHEHIDDIDTKKYLWIPYMNTFDNINQKIREINLYSKQTFNKYFDEGENKIIFMTHYLYSNYKEQCKELKLIKENISVDELDTSDRYGKKLKKLNNIYSNYLGGEVIFTDNIDKCAPIESNNILLQKLDLASELVVDRTGGICIVKAVPQWYIDYGNSEWKNMALNCVSAMRLHPEIKTKLILAINTLREWGVSRPFGLGTKLPMDDGLLIDSLSDSTIYPAYYTISHLIHTDLSGKHTKYDPSQFTEQVWNYIFTNAEPNDEMDSIDPHFRLELDVMKKSFEYFYPVDMRISGKDLINNHLAMYIFNHVAIFDKKYYPVSINCNGWILVDGKKMAKSEGNFITVESALESNSVDAVRMALGDSGDSFDDANYVKANAGDHCVLKLFSWMETIEKYMNEATTDDVEMNYIDLMFEQIFMKLANEVVENYSNQKYRPVIRDAFHEWNTLREKYRIYSKYFGKRMNFNLGKKIIDLQILLMYPIIPHITTHIWKNILKKPDIRKCIYGNYSIGTDYNVELVTKYNLMEDIITMSRVKLERAKKKKNTISSVKISANTELIDDNMKKIIESQLKYNIMYEHNDTGSTAVFITE
jgi:leucyl-tRNA synthetase